MLKSSPGYPRQISFYHVKECMEGWQVKLADRAPAVQKLCPDISSVWCWIVKDNKDDSQEIGGLSKEVSEKDSRCLLAKHYFRQYDCNLANHGRHGDNKKEIDWSCSLSSAIARVVLRWTPDGRRGRGRPKKTWEENGGDRDEARLMGMGLLGESCSRQKEMEGSCSCLM